MPRMDGTGPAGQGLMTGRGQGSCGTSGPTTPPVAQQQPSSWLGRMLQGALGGFGVSGVRRGGGRRQGRGRRGSF